MVDGEQIKADTWYKLDESGEVVEVHTGCGRVDAE